MPLTLAAGPPLVTGTTATITTQSFAWPANAALVALVSYDTQGSATGYDQTVTSAGRTWTRLGRKSLSATSTGGAAAGSHTGVEIWYGHPLGTSATNTVSTTSTTPNRRSLQVVPVPGAETVPGGAVGWGDTRSGLPSASVVTTRAGSYVFAVCADWTEQTATGTYAAGQTQISAALYAGAYTLRSWRTTNTVPASGTTVAMTSTAPGGQDTPTLAVEIREAAVTLTPVPISRATSWNVAAPPDFYSNTYSDVYGAAPAPPVPVAISRTTSWNVAVADFYSDTYTDVYGAAPPPGLAKVTITRATSWNVANPPVVLSRATSWATYRTVTGSRTTKWDTLIKVPPVVRSTAWATNVIQPVTVTTTPGLRLRVFEPFGADLGYLPTPSDAKVSYPRNDVGGLEFSYAIAAPKSSLLGRPCEVAVEFSPDGGSTWIEPPNSRFVYVTDASDPLRGDATFEVGARSYVWRLSRAAVYPPAVPREDGKRAFLSCTPGDILKTLLVEAQNRGALTGITHPTFTTTLDSAGQPWANQLTIYYTPGVDYLTVLQDLADQGFIDFKMQGRQLFVFNPDGVLAVDRTVGPSQVSLVAGRDLTEAPFRRTWEGLADSAYLAGDGVDYQYTDPSAVTPWGRQEVFISDGRISDPGTMAAWAQAALELGQKERVEYTRGLDFARATTRPFWDYFVGDYVWSRTDGTNPPERLRVHQITLTTKTGIVSGNVVLNDRFLEAEVRAKRRISGITNGATSGDGTGGPIPPEAGADFVAPGKVTGLNGSSLAFAGPGGFPQAQVTLVWDAVQFNADSTLIDDFDHYEVYRRPFGSLVPHETDPLQPGDSRMFGVTTQTVYDSSPYPVGSNWWFYVVAVDREGNRSVRSDERSVGMATDNTPPQAPTAPILTPRLGIVGIYWDGNPATGSWPPDLDYVEVHVSTTNNFAPSDATLFDRLYGEGTAVLTGAAFGVPVFAKFVAVDKTPLKGVPSAQGTATPVQIVNADLITNIVDARLLGDGAVDTAAIADLAVGTANMKDLSVVTAKIADLAVNNAKIGNLDVGKLTSGTINADMLVAGRFTTALAGNRVQFDATGVRGFQGSALTVHLDPTPGQLRIYNTTDAHHTSTGHGLQLGRDTGSNVILDDNEIMARFNGSYGALNLNKDGGAVVIGGKPGGFGSNDIGVFPADDQHAMHVRASLLLENVRLGDYTEEFNPLVVGWRGNKAIWIDRWSIGSIGAGFFAENININPKYRDGDHHFKYTIFSSNALAARRIGPNNAMIRAWEGMDVAVQFINSEIRITNNATDNWANIHALDFIQFSSEERVKTDITAFDATEIVRQAPGRRWRYKAGTTVTDDQVHYGPMLDDLPADMVVESEDGKRGYGVAALVGVHHEAIRQLLERLDVLEGRRGPQR